MRGQAHLRVVRELECKAQVAVDHRQCNHAGGGGHLVAASARLHDVAWSQSGGGTQPQHGVVTRHLRLVAHAASSRPQHRRCHRRLQSRSCTLATAAAAVTPTAAAADSVGAASVLGDARHQAQLAACDRRQCRERRDVAES